MSRCILVIDDDEDCRTVLKLIFEAHGYDAIAAENGRDGLAIARALQPFLIVSDLMMPGMDAYMFRAEQVADPEIREIPVVLMTGHADGARVARELGVAGFFGKPIPFPDLLDFVRATLTRLDVPP